MESVKQIIRDVPDFPKEGIIFKDITPLLGDPVAFQKTINSLKDRYADKSVDAVVGVEARGFIFASALAYALGSGVVMVRKPGKLPYTPLKFIRMPCGQDKISSSLMMCWPLEEPCQPPSI